MKKINLVSVGDSDILGASKEQIVNKTWVNKQKQLTGMLVHWRLHMESFVVNKQLMGYSNTYVCRSIFALWMKRSEVTPRLNVIVIFSRIIFEKIVLYFPVSLNRNALYSNGSRLK